MNNNSIICNILQNEELHDEESIFKYFDKMNIKVKFKDGKFAIFNYGIEADFFNPIVREARGIIINYKTLDVVCWAFNKFGKYNEPYVDTIDWNSAHVLENLDGSIIKLWYDHYSKKWIFSTNSTIYASEACVSSEMSSFMTFDDLIKSAVNYKDIDFDELDKNSTYIFELVSKYNRIVVIYNETMLYHIGTRDNVSGKEYEVGIGIEKPHVYHINSLDECIRVAGTMSKMDKIRGFVVVDKYYHRIKIKSLEYMVLHTITNLTTRSKSQFIKLILSEYFDIPTITRNYPNLSHIIKFYDYKISEILYNIKVIINITKKLNQIFNGNRKEIAIRIKDNKYSPFAFKWLSNTELSEDDFVSQLTEKDIINFIPLYENDVNFYKCFDNIN